MYYEWCSRVYSHVEQDEDGEEGILVFCNHISIYVNMKVEVVDNQMFCTLSL